MSCVPHMGLWGSWWKGSGALTLRLMVRINMMGVEVRAAPSRKPQPRPHHAQVLLQAPHKLGQAVSERRGHVGPAHNKEADQALEGHEGGRQAGRGGES